jgi:hypothetical protein
VQGEAASKKLGDSAAASAAHFELEHRQPDPGRRNHHLIQLEDHVEFETISSIWKPEVVVCYIAISQAI